MINDSVKDIFCAFMCVICMNAVTAMQVDEDAVIATAKATAKTAVRMAQSAMAKAANEEDQTKAEEAMSLAKKAKVGAKEAKDKTNSLRIPCRYFAGRECRFHAPDVNGIIAEVMVRAERSMATAEKSISISRSRTIDLLRRPFFGSDNQGLQETFATGLIGVDEKSVDENPKDQAKYKSQWNSSDIDDYYNSVDSK